MQEEIWKDIPEFAGYYQASNLGKIKSLKRSIYDKNGSLHYVQFEKILKLQLNTKGYYQVRLCKNFSCKNFRVHKLIALTFLNHKINGYEEVVDHINSIKTDNRLENLQILDQRKNTHKDSENLYSNFIGVTFDKSRNLFKSQINIKSKLIFLGRFKTENEAAEFYQKAVNNLNFYNNDNKSFRAYLKSLK